ncbi:hypothetical protein RhiLY_10105 [Ceratobasidium sp. AG-Ba]|nr:hypothetical protein RhiLY_10105 [Ceratobasidium sp. AG-Ba]
MPPRPHPSGRPRCNACIRYKNKCFRELPRCRACVRANRECVYEPEEEDPPPPPQQPVAYPAPAGIRQPRDFPTEWGTDESDLTDPPSRQRSPPGARDPRRTRLLGSLLEGPRIGQKRQASPPELDPLEERRKRAGRLQEELDAEMKAIQDMETQREKVAQRDAQPPSAMGSSMKQRREAYPEHNRNLPGRKERVPSVENNSSDSDDTVVPGYKADGADYPPPLQIVRLLKQKWNQHFSLALLRDVYCARMATSRQTGKALSSSSNEYVDKSLPELEMSYDEWNQAEQAEHLIAEAAAQSQLQTPAPSVSPAALSSSSLSISTLGSIDSGSSSSYVFPPPAQSAAQGYEPDLDSDEPSQQPESPRTPRRTRQGRPSTLTAPSRPVRPSTDSERPDSLEPESSPTVARQRGASPFPSVASLGLRTGSAFGQQHTSFPVGPKTPSSLALAAASVPVGSMSISDALAQIHSLCGGQFYDDGRPKPEVEYRRNFIFATLGLSDEQIASLWANHLVYDGPAHNWYETLVASATGKAAAQKWSTLQPEIEKRWPTPARDAKATARRH